MPLTKKKAKKRVRKARLWDETGGKCVYCNRFIELKERTLDHIYPRSWGGHGGMSNMIPACGPCNVERATKFPPSQFVHEVWKDWVLAREENLGISSRQMEIIAKAAETVNSG